jgi:acetoacetyl-CoA reductase
VGDWQSTVDAFTKAKADHGPIDVLVNNAGITKDRVFLKMTREELANLVGTATETVIRLLAEFKSDSILELEGKKIKIASKFWNIFAAALRL